MAANNQSHVFFLRSESAVKGVLFTAGMTVKSLLEKCGYTLQEVAAFAENSSSLTVRSQPLGELGINQPLVAGDLVTLMPSIKGA